MDKSKLNDRELVGYFSPIVFENRGSSGADYEIRQLTNKIGDKDDPMPGNDGWCYDANQENQIVMDRQMSSKGQDTYFTFYKVDGERTYVIANKATGLVMEHVEESFGGPIYGAWKGSKYTGKSSQIISVDNDYPNNFRISTYPDGTKKFLDACNNRYDNKRKISSVWERDVEGNKQVLEYPVISRMERITLPKLPETSSLGPVPELTGFDNPLPENDEVKRAVIGSVHVPCILVNDIMPIADRIKKHPYYVLEYRQYWHCLWSDVFAAGSNDMKTEETGMYFEAQENMKKLIGVSIGADLGLKFNNKSGLFKKQIVQGLNTGESYGAELGDTTDRLFVENHDNVPVRFAKYARAHEFVLKDSTGEIVGGPWVAVDKKDKTLKSYKK